jgi:hypothetical protein
LQSLVRRLCGRRSYAVVGNPAQPSAQSLQYVKICSLYGVGFYYIPGTDMCIKVGGWARQEVAYGYNGSMTSGPFSNNLNNRSTDNLTWRYKGTVTVDSRNQTEYGTVRSYVAIGASSNFNDNEGAGLYANRWFIQWAGFTFGHATSFYDFYSIGGNQFGFATGAADTGDGGWDVVAYTAQFGNGLSASLSAEANRRTKISAAGAAAGASYSPSAWTGYGVNYAGSNAPDIVANLRVDQAWGSAQIMGALHQVNATYYGATEGTGYPSDKWGFAIGGGLKLNAPMIGAGDYLQVEASYTQGALRYNNNTAVTGDFVKFDGNSVGFGIQSDAVYGGTVGANASDLELTSAWSVNAAYTHFWNKSWKTTLWGSYMSVMYGSNANAMLCSSIGEGTGSGTTAVAATGCDMDWSIWGLGLRTQWNVTKDFYLGLEVLYANLQSASVSGGTVALAGAGLGTKPAGAYSVSDQDTWAVRFRAHKDFYP